MNPERVFRVTMHPTATTGVKGGTLSLLTPFEARAQELVGQLPAFRSYKTVPWADLTDIERARMLLALERAGASAPAPSPASAA